MLIKFKTGNFRSFDEIQEFTMICGSTRTHSEHISDRNGVKVLKNATMYGANAAGKTSFVQAIDVSRRLVLLSPSVAGNGFRRMYCRTSAENETKDTYFEYLIEISGTFYSYGFEIVLSTNRVSSEWLYLIDPAKESETRIFEKSTDPNEGYVFGEMFKKEDLSRLRVYTSDLFERNDALFLNEMSRKNFGNNARLAVFHNVFNWFGTKLMVNSISVPDKNAFADAGNILNALDTDISQIKFRSASAEEMQSIDPITRGLAEATLRTNMSVGGPNFFIGNDWTCFELVNNGDIRVSKMYSEHDPCQSQFSLEEESSGAAEVLSLIAMILSQNEGVTYVQDEFGSKMHPMLAYRLIEMFQKKDTTHSNQLIITTHQTGMMTLDLYRRDEIWFAEKKNGGTAIFSLEEFRERFDKKLDKAYLEGRYGALPAFNELSSNADQI